MIQPLIRAAAAPFVPPAPPLPGRIAAWLRAAMRDLSGAPRSRWRQREDAAALDDRLRRDVGLPGRAPDTAALRLMLWTLRQ